MNSHVRHLYQVLIELAYTSTRHLWKRTAAIQTSVMAPAVSISQHGSSLLVSLLLLSLEMETPVMSYLASLYYWCIVDGVEYEGFDPLFTRRGQSHCLKYRCVNQDMVELYEEGCEYKGVCHPVGSTFVDACPSYVCRKFSQNGKTIYRADEYLTGCQRVSGCYPVGSTFTENCLTYTCTERTVGGNITAEAVVISGGCEFKGVCHPANMIFTDGCSSYFCRTLSRNGTSIYTAQTSSPSPGCQSGGVCHRPGSTFTANCTTYTCTEMFVGFGAREVYEAEVISQGCVDYNGTCHDSGSLVSRMGDNGVVQHNCSCTVTTSGVQYTCPT